MTTGVAVLNFGEPPESSFQTVVDYLERIFFANAELDGDVTEREARERSRRLAERRAPGLVEEYEAIAGSPLNPQARAQADAVEAELRERGYDARTYVGMQFTEPFIEDAVASARDDGVDRLVGLPVYPLCGASTTVAALDELADEVQAGGWEVPVHEVTGWHRHPGYTRLRADNVRAFVDREDLDLSDPDTELVFSAHGTPVHYLEAGNRYDEYVHEYCATLASMLGVETYTLGFQNHENRGVPWTEPAVEDAIEDVDAEHVVVEPVSFMHEQSETLSELDDELRDGATEAGLEFYRVPIPHDDDRFPTLLADLVEPFVADFEPGYYQLRTCQCKPGGLCLNAPRGE